MQQSPFSLCTGDLCSSCACLQRGFHPIPPLLMASVVIEFDAAHLQANNSAVRQSPDSTVQLCWYFTGCIIKLNNPFWMEAKWWNSSHWPRPNHKQKGILMLLPFQSVSWLPRCIINCWTWNLSPDRWCSYRVLLKRMRTFTLHWSVLWLQRLFTAAILVFCCNYREILKTITSSAFEIWYAFRWNHANSQLN